MARKRQRWTDMGHYNRGERPSYAATRPGAPAAPSGGGGGGTLSSYTNETKPRVFISFHIADESQVNLLRYQAKNSETLEFTDYSVKEPFDEAWKTQCAERLKRCTVVVVAIGEDTYSPTSGLVGNSKGTRAWHTRHRDANLQ